MIVVVGKSGSGKSTIVNKLCETYGFNRIVTTTTRPKRKGERQDIDYHFVSDEAFEKMKESGEFVETQEFKVASGDIWKYGSSLKSIESAKDTDIIILTPEGCQKLIDNNNLDNIIVIYIYANQRTIETRLNERGDKKDEISRRMRKDNVDFKNVEADFTAYNHFGYSISETASLIVKFLSNRGVNVEKD